MTKFKESEISFLKSTEAARIATSDNNIPHVKPVSFIFYKNTIIIATDYQTKSFQSIKINPHASIVIDKYVPGNHKAVCIQGQVKIIESGKEFAEYYEMFYEKFQWVKNDPWKENEAQLQKEDDDIETVEVTIDGAEATQEQQIQQIIQSIIGLNNSVENLNNATQ